MLSKQLKICYVLSTDQIADYLIKALSHVSFCNLRDKLCVSQWPSQLRGMWRYKVLQLNPIQNNEVVVCGPNCSLFGPEGVNSLLCLVVEFSLLYCSTIYSCDSYPFLLCNCIINSNHQYKRRDVIPTHLSLLCHILIYMVSWNVSMQV